MPVRTIKNVSRDIIQNDIAREHGESGVGRSMNVDVLKRAVCRKRAAEEDGMS